MKHIKIIWNKVFSRKSVLFLLTREKALRGYLLPVSQVYISPYFVPTRNSEGGRGSLKIFILNPPLFHFINVLKNKLHDFYRYLLIKKYINITSWNKPSFLQKLTVVWLIKNFAAFYGNRNVHHRVDTSTRNGHCSLSWATLIQSDPPPSLLLKVEK
jgi:hypothetical protein